MKKYCVYIREVHVSHRFVEANSPEEAKDLAGDEACSYLEYSHTLDKDTWTVEEAPGCGCGATDGQELSMGCGVSAKQRRPCEHVSGFESPLELAYITLVDKARTYSPERAAVDSAVWEPINDDDLTKVTTWLGGMLSRQGNLRGTSVEGLIVAQIINRLQHVERASMSPPALPKDCHVEEGSCVDPCPVTGRQALLVANLLEHLASDRHEEKTIMDDEAAMLLNVARHLRASAWSLLNK